MEKKTAHILVNEGPQTISQKGPMPTQGTFTQGTPAKDVPYQSGRATPNKNVR